MLLMAFSLPFYLQSKGKGIYLHNLKMNVQKPWNKVLLLTLKKVSKIIGI